MGHDKWRDSARSVVQIIDTPHNFRSYVSFTGFAFYIAVRCGFDKHLYLTSCLNAYNHNTCIRLAKMALFIIIEDRQTQVQERRWPMPYPLQPP